MREARLTGSLKVAVVAALLIALCAIFFTTSAPPNQETAGGVEGTIRHRFPELKDALSVSSQLNRESCIVDGKKVDGYVRDIGITPPAELKPEEREAWSARSREGTFNPFLPETFNEPTVIQSGLIKAIVRSKGANPVQARNENGKIVYTQAYPETDSLHAVGAASSEEFLLLHSKQAPTRFEYSLSLGAGTDIKLCDGALRLTKSGSTLTIAAPYVVDAKGIRSNSAVHWELSTASGKTREIALVLNPAGLTYPLVIDPTWISTGTMTGARTGHTATLLNNGLVLVVGGNGPGGSIQRLAELYDPQSQTWRPAKNSAPPNAGIDNRANHTATLLQNGTVIVIGSFYGGSSSAKASIFDPVTETWTYLPDLIPSPAAGYSNALATPRYNHTATLLPNGNVLIAGGKPTAGGGAVNTAELFVPGSGFKVTGGPPIMQKNRQLHTATLLKNGDVLISGGDNPTKTSELYSSNAFVGLATMNVMRTGHTATLVSDGTATGHVIVVEGDGALTAEYYVPSLFVGTAGSWNPAGSLTNARTGGAFTASSLTNGKVLIASGDAGGTAEIYNPATKTFASGGSIQTLTYHTATTLPTGKVLVAGGTMGGNAQTPTYLYDATFGGDSTAATGGAPVKAHDQGLAFSLSNGDVLVTAGNSNQSEVFSAGAWTNAQVTGSDGAYAGVILPSGKVLDITNAFGGPPQIYTPTGVGMGSWAATGQVSIRYPDNSISAGAPYFAGAAVLQNGDVLLTGGYAAGFTFKSCEIYSTFAGTWSFTASMSVPRSDHTLTPLPNGKILAAGGTDSYVFFSSCELYDPATGTWSPTGSMSTARKDHTATLLPNGKVMVVGGVNSSSTLTAAEIYDPATGTWSSAGVMSQARSYHTATLLNSGLLLIAGGTASTATDIYNWGSGSWSNGAALQLARTKQAAALLPSGKVLLVGGTGTNTSEIYDSGLGVAAADQPVLNALGNLPLGSKLVATGSKFMGVSEGSGGGNSNDSGSNSPLLLLKSLVNGQWSFMNPDPATGWNDTSFTTVPVTGFPAGPAQVTIITNGIPSVTQVVTLTNTPTTVSVTSSPPATTVNTNFSAPVKVTVVNNGTTTPQPVPFAGVIFTIAAGGSGASATFPGPATTATVSADANGVATSPVLTANQIAGTFSVTATVVNYPGVNITTTLTNTAATPATISISGGNGQSIQNGGVFAAPLQALVRDQYGNPVPNATVFFTAPISSPTGTFYPTTTNLVGNSVTKNGTTSVTGSLTFAGSVSPSDVIRIPGGGGIEDRLVSTVAGTNLTVGTAFANSATVTTAQDFSGVATNSISVTTDATGTATANPIKATTKSGNYTVSASVPGVGTPANFNLTNNPGPATTLSVTGLASPRVAGTPGTMRVTAFDASGNVATTYTQTVTFSDNVAGAQLPPAYTFSAAVDQGTQMFSLQLNKAGAQTLTVTDGTISGTLAVTVNPAPIASFAVTGFAPTVAGVAGGVTATALDSFGNTVTSYLGTVGISSDDPQMPAVTNQAFIVADNGVHSFGNVITLKTAATHFVRAFDVGQPGINGAQSGIITNPAPASTLIVSGYPMSTTAGTSNSFTVTAKDPFNNVATGYTGTVRFTSTDAIATLPANTAFTLADAGVKSFNAALKTASPPPQSITATDTLTGTINGTQPGIMVQPTTATTLAVTNINITTAGQAGPFRVQAKDTFGNVARGYTGTVGFTSSDSQASLPPNYTFAPSDNGDHVFVGNLKTIGNPTVTATDAVTATITGQMTVALLPGPTQKLNVSGFVNGVSGLAQTFTVNAVDFFGNLTPGYLGTVTFGSSDPQAVKPANYTFTGADAGSHQFTNGAVLKTAGVQSFNAGDTVTVQIAGNQPNINVTAGPFSKLKIVSPNPVNVGSAFNVTVTAIDSNGNFVSTGTDTVAITTTDVNATPPVPAALVGGGKSFSVTFNSTGGQTLTASDQTDPTKTAGSTGVLVNIGAPARLLVLVPGESLAAGTPTGKSGTPSKPVAGTAFNVVVFAVDAGNNPVNSTDTVVLTSSDAAAALPASLPLVNGTATLAVTLKTAGTQTVTLADNTNPNVPTNTSSNMTVLAGALKGLLVSGFPSPTTQGVARNFTATAVDAFGNTVPSYAGTVHFTSSDTAAVLPADYTFVAADNSTRSFSATLKTVPSQSLTATDTASATVTGTQSSIVVNALVPTVTAISPNAAALNAAALTVTVTGTNFLANSVVQWNGSSRTTTFVSATQLTAAITAADLAAQGRANVTVFQPAPGGGSSNPGIFFVYSGATVGTWIVTNTLDAGPGSLRFALSQHQSADKIIFDPVVFDLSNADAATLINVFSELPPLSNSNVTVDAQDRRVTVNGTAAASANGLVITSNGNTVMGLSIVGFPRSGVTIRNGAQNNTIGGSRLLGVGKNGQGLRLSNNGNFGAEITGAGTNNNVVKGCWIGLDASGTSAQPNVAGVIVSGGASSNTIGGTGPGEANYVSGNTFEGVTFTGDGTNDNVLIGNVIGLPAVQVSARDDGGDTLFTRGGAGNGAAGVFLTKGTQRTQIGGTAPGQGNAVGFNGGNGIEVRANTSKKNAMRGNRIARNIKGGITLFDGSNNGVTPPKFGQIVILAQNRAAAPATVHVRVQGTTDAPSGTVELFNDGADQGGLLIGRGGVTTGGWSVETDISTSQNLTATVTDADGNTSRFAVLSSPVITSAILATAAPGQAFTYQITATNSPTSFGATGLPDGIAVDTATGIISGKTTLTGSFNVALTATNASGTGTGNLVLFVDNSYATVPADPTLALISQLLVTDPANPGPPPINAGTITAPKASATINFTSPTKDNVKLTLNVAVPAGYLNDGATMGVVFGGVAEKAVLTAKGVSPKGTNAFKVKGAPMPKGSTAATPTTASTNIVVTFSVMNKDLNTGLIAGGMTNKTSAKAGDTIVVPIALTIVPKDNLHRWYYQGTVNMLYKSTQDKVGRANLKK